MGLKQKTVCRGHLGGWVGSFRQWLGIKLVHWGRKLLGEKPDPNQLFTVTVPELLEALGERHRNLVCIRIGFDAFMKWDCFGGSMTAMGMLERVKHLINIGQMADEVYDEETINDDEDDDEHIQNA